MNQRIQELFWKAGGKTSVRNLMSTPVQIVETNELWDDEIEKFAQLIVEQLVVLVENHAQQYHQPTWAFEIVEDIKEQFGATHE